jgi:hypothetical protein
MAVAQTQDVVQTQNKAQSKIDWWQLVMLLVALLCFAGAAILWTHSGQTP